MPEVPPSPPRSAIPEAFRWTLRCALFFFALQALAQFLGRDADPDLPASAWELTAAKLQCLITAPDAYSIFPQRLALFLSWTFTGCLLGAGMDLMRWGSRQRNNRGGLKSAVLLLFLGGGFIANDVASYWLRMGFDQRVSGATGIWVANGLDSSTSVSLEKLRAWNAPAREVRDEDAAFLRSVFTEPARRIAIEPGLFITRGRPRHPQPPTREIRFLGAGGLIVETDGKTFYFSRELSQWPVRIEGSEALARVRRIAGFPDKTP